MKLVTQHAQRRRRLAQKIAQFGVPAARLFDPLRNGWLLIPGKLESAQKPPPGNLKLAAALVGQKLRNPLKSAAMTMKICFTPLLRNRFQLFLQLIFPFKA